MRVADYIADYLVREGVTHVFSLSGGGFMHTLDGLSRNPELNIIFHHHEQAAGMAAEAYARARNGIGICFATSGPGSTNLTTAIAGAYLDSAPVVFIVGQSKVSQTIRHANVKGLRQFGTFEVDSVSISEGLTKESFFVERANDIPYIFEKAFVSAQSGRPGPILIEIPIDIQGAQIDFDRISSFSWDYNDPALTDEQLECVLGKISDSSKPLLLIGHGVRVSGGVSEFLKFVDTIGVPVVSTQLGKDSISYNHDLFIGHVGTRGDRAGNAAVQSADLIISIGSSLHTFTTGYETDLFAPDAMIVQVDTDASNFEKGGVSVDIRIHSDVKLFLKKMNSAVQRCHLDMHLNWVTWNQKNKRNFPVYGEGHKVEKGALNIYHSLEIMNTFSPSDSIVIGDAGSVFFVLGHAWKVKEGQRVLISGGLGSMGWSLPAATGAAIASRDKKVICMTGDGSLMTNVHELSVMVGYNLNIVVVVFNNNGYISIKNTQQSYFNDHFSGVNSESGVYMPDLKMLTESMGMVHHRVECDIELKNIFQMAMEKRGPVFIEVISNQSQEIIPAVLSKKMADGTMQSQSLNSMFPFLDDNFSFE